MHRSLWKLLTTVIAFGAINSAVAAKDYKNEIPCPVPPSLKEGWYIGGQLGYDNFRNHNIIDTPSISTVVTHPRLGANGWAGGLLLGYGYMYNKWFYMGFEIFADSSNFSQQWDVTTAGSTYSNTFISQSMIGFGFLPGIRITDSTLTYGKLGWNRAVVQIKETLTGALPSGRTNDSMGFVFGFGIETLIKNNWSIRSEYDHIYLNSFITKPYGSYFVPTDNQFMFALIYHFDSAQVTELTGTVTG